jgi:hypothetical protein
MPRRPLDAGDLPAIDLKARRRDPQQVEGRVGLRRQRLTSPVIARQLSMALSTVGLILRRIGLNRLPCSSAGRR